MRPVLVIFSTASTRSLLCVGGIGHGWFRNRYMFVGFKEIPRLMGVFKHDLVCLLMPCHQLSVAARGLQNYRLRKSDVDSRGCPAATVWRNALPDGAYCSYNPHGSRVSISRVDYTWHRNSGSYRTLCVFPIFALVEKRLFPG